MDRNPCSLFPVIFPVYGQARKSLWIETAAVSRSPSALPGQARKSLWIETGSVLFILIQYIGQARKSLWIETELFTYIVGT